MLKLFRDLTGIRSDHCYAAGLGSIALTFLAWGLSMLRPSDSKAQADRWGIFIGHWAPTFMALGLALKQEEMEEEVLDA